MRKGLIKVFLLAVMAVLFLGSEKANAGHDIGFISKENPCVQASFTITPDDPYYGLFFSISQKATNTKMTIVNLSDGDAYLKADFINSTGDNWEVLKTLTFKKGKKKSTFNLPDFKKGDSFFIAIKDPKFYDSKKMDIGICVYSEGLGGKKYDFVTAAEISSKISLSAENLTLEKGKKAKLKVTLAKSLKSKGVTWKTSDKKVATVSSTGKITAKGYGTAVITCTSKENKKYSVKCTVTVPKKDSDKDNDTSDTDNTGKDNDSSGNGKIDNGLVNCSSCNGTGKTFCTNCGGSGKARCLLCGGTGGSYQTQLSYNPITGLMDTQMVRVNCSACGGSGSSLCGTCMGTGRVNCLICGGTGHVHK